MEIPFYLSFKEFEKNYQADLKKWFEHYCDADELDFLKDLLELYRYYLCYNVVEDKLDFEGVIEIMDCLVPFRNKGNLQILGAFFTTYKDKEGNLFQKKTITMIEYAQHVLDLVNMYLKNNKVEIVDGVNIKDYIGRRDIISDNDSFGYWINFDIHKLTLPFLKTYIPINGKIVNATLYRNFGFAVVRIANFIDERLKSLNAFEFSFYNRLKSEAKSQEQNKSNFDKEAVPITSKIKITGSLQALGYIFTELFEKGYIEPQRKNGKVNIQGTAKMILDHFEFIREEVQPSLESVRQSLFTQNKFSNDKQDLFKIPNCSQLEK
ncbi:hypothetical protein [Chryseobacterium lathyri]|uniref:hypothetical protein n=1 Tax=Chryseobacterium lathyri TaxID=395933 RepID=UPI001CBEB29D|nr:hypothetical protein [Chryseobacterium lathyri]